MIVTLDLTRLLAEGKITQPEHDKLLTLGSATGNRLIFNILIGFGVVAVAAGIIALVPDATTGVVVGAALLLAGLAILVARLNQWQILGNICVLVGALVLAGGVIILTEAAQLAFIGIAVGFAAAGILARSGLLVSLSVLALASALGGRTGYMHAMYLLGMTEPAWSALAFSALALVTFLASRRVPAAYERLAIIAARTCVLLVNLALWIGSLWGDAIEGTGIVLPALAFVVVWAVALIVLALWGASRNRLWVVNVAAIFGAIHFYTQWFERLGVQAQSVLIGGIIALGFALLMRHLNRRSRDPSPTEAS